MASCSHDHEAVDATLVKRLRFIKLCLDTLLIPDNDNREQAYKAALRQLEIIGVDKANQPASEVMNGWVFATEFMNGIEPDITAPLTPDEVTNFFLRVEALSETPLKGREEIYAKEQARLAELSEEKPVAGLVRMLMLCKRMIHRRSAFEHVNISSEEVFTSNHLISKDLADWKAMGLKPHWFTEEFLIFRDSDSERLALDEAEQELRSTKEEELIFKLFSIRHTSPEGLGLIGFYRKKLAEARTEASGAIIGEQADDKS